MVTFTVPQELRPLIMQLQQKAYSLMFAASAEVVKQPMGTEKYLGVSGVGFTSILHTWGGQG